MKERFSMAVLFIAVALTLLAVILALNFTTGGKKIEHRVERLYSAADPSFAWAMGVLLGPAILPCNRFEALLNGDRIFPAMVAAIRDARNTITFESYIYWSDAIGKEFADALAERARAGVKVHVLLDWLGSNKQDPTQLATMEAAGVEVRKFHKLAWYALARYPLLRRWAGGGVNAGGISRQLDQGYRCRLAWRRILPGTAVSRQRRSSDVQQFALRRQREHASDVPAGDYVGATYDPLVECLFRPRRSQ
jgi:hypothetical protein